MRKGLSRRTMLRGLLGGSTVAVGLPLLEQMLSGNGDALANGAPLPDRFGVWFWGNGCKPDRWIPTVTGAGWSPSEQLAPLAAVQPWVSVVSGCEIKTATWPHHSGMTGIMTGQVYEQLGTTRDTIVSTFGRQSVDQDAADWFEGQAPFRSIELGVTTFRGTDEGTTFQHLSHNGPNNPNPSEYDPGALYRRLFAIPASPEIDLARQSVLDLVAVQASALQSRLGKSDRDRMQQHLDSIRDLENRLAAGPLACEPGAEPTAVADVDGLEQIEQKNQIMSDLLATALSCDLMRAFSVNFSTCGSGVIVWEVGATDGLHSSCHFEASPQPIVSAAIQFTMTQLAYCLQKLRDTPEGDGSLLDHLAMLCTTELSDGQIHTNTEFPILIAGKGNGRLKGGWHYRSPSAENTSTAVLTALHGAGVDLPSWGTDAGYTDQVFTDLLT